MSVTLRPVKWLLIAPMLPLAACAADASVILQLVSLGNEDPYAAVSSIEVTASLNDRVISRERVVFDGQPIALEPLEPKTNMVVRATGYNADDEVVSRGLARPEIPDDGDTCCVLTCFCTLAVFEVGDCGCGSDACVDECFE
jgi:hypothetical protein